MSYRGEAPVVLVKLDNVNNVYQMNKVRAALKEEQLIALMENLLHQSLQVATSCRLYQSRHKNPTLG